MRNKYINLFIAAYTCKFSGIRSYASGPVQPLLDFFTKRVAKTVLVEQPLPQSEDLVPTMEIYEKDVLVKKHEYPKILRLQYWMRKKTKEQGRTMIRLKIRDILSTFYFFFFKSGQRQYDLFIGLECVNASVGIIFKKLGLVKMVVYYVFDYTPIRYKNRLLNWLYLALDKFCAYYSDYVWNISEAIEESRCQLGYKKGKMASSITVHYGLDLDKIKLLPIESLDKNTLVYAGSLSPENGIEWVVDILPDLLKKLPRLRLLLIGNGSWLSKLKEKVRQKNLSKNVHFTGFILDHREVERLLCQSYVAVAPYPDMWNSTKKYGDVIKIRTYLACGLPVVTTQVPPVSKEIEKNHAGIVYKDQDKNQFIRAVLKLFNDERVYKLCRQNSIKMAKDNTWENNFIAAIRQMKELRNL